ncbi:MAG: sulfatase [Limisphaerales bacterium]
MNSRCFALALLLAALSTLTPVRAADAAKPNFILINIDDMGYADIEPFGSKLNRTPHLNRLAAEGMKLTSFYAAPVCSPSRASLMTGCYPKRALPIPHVLFPAGAVGLHPNERTVAEVLKDAGYATGCIGKWHLGDQPEFLPTRQGFDYYLGLPYSNDMGPGEDGSKSDLGAKLPEPKGGVAGAGAETGLTGASQPPLPLLENEKVITRVRQDEQQGIVERYTTAAVKFLRDHRDRRFFLYLPHNAVHFPLYPGKAFVGKSGNGLYGDWVEEVDWSVGQVMAALRELKLDRNTLVLFTTDNGGTPRAVNAPLRGFKASTWEGGMRVPTIVWWPGQIPAGTSSGAIAGMMDVLPTFAKLAGGAVPSDRKIDGVDLWPVLSGKAQESSRETFYYFRGAVLEAVRSGPWKLHLIARGGPTGPKAKQAKEAGEQPPILHNLDTDIGESKNVAATNPEVVKRLQALAAQMDADLGTEKFGPGCRPLGRVEKPQPLIGRDGKIRVGFEPKP